jgi:hypothetical protein
LQKLFRSNQFAPEFKEKVLSFVPRLNYNNSQTTDFIVKTITGLQLEEAKLLLASVEKELASLR